MNITQYLDPEHPYFFYILGAAILLVYIAVSRRKLRDLGEIKSDEMDDEEARIPRGKEHFTQLDKTMKWKTVLLIVLIIIGLYLVIFSK